MRRSRIAIIALIAGLSVASVLLVVRIVQPEPTTRPAVGTLVWSDEFDGPAGSAPNPEKWVPDVGGNGWGNQELQYYTDEAANATLDGQGHLVIEARETDAELSCHYGPCRYTSARLKTAGTFGQMYGRVEARMKVPEGQGLWPAFWMLGDDIAVTPWPASGEIDVMEHVGHEPHAVKGSAHGPGFSGTDAYDADHYFDQKVAEDFQVFAVDWTADQLIWSVNDHPYGVLDREDLGPDQHWVFDKPYMLMLNLAVGGQWPGPPGDDTVFPAHLLVDYVRVYDHEGAPPRGSQLTVGESGHISGYAHKCLDVRRGVAEPGAPAHLWDCLPVDSQRWTLSEDQMLRSLGLCLAPRGETAHPGAALVVTECTGAPSQRFTYDAATEALVHPASGLCLDVAGWSTRNGARLQFWDCAGTTNQRWTYSP